MTESSVSHLEIPKSARAMRPCGKHKRLDSLRSQCKIHLAWRYVRPCKICPRRSHISLAAGVGEVGSLATRIHSSKLLSAASITRPGCPLVEVKTAYAFTTLGWPPSNSRATSRSTMGDAPAFAPAATSASLKLSGVLRGTFTAKHMPRNLAEKTVP